MNPTTSTAPAKYRTLRTITAIGREVAVLLPLTYLKKCIFVNIDNARIAIAMPNTAIGKPGAEDRLLHGHNVNMWIRFYGRYFQGLHSEL
jgi:hypothetical protein